jgi:hypothetical protein
MQLVTPFEVLHFLAHCCLCENRKDPNYLYVHDSHHFPRVWSTRPFTQCQMQETLARDIFSFARFGIMRGFIFGLRPLVDSVCARTFLCLCPVLKPAQMQDSRAQTNWARTNAGLTSTNGHSAPRSAVSTHNHAPIVGRMHQTRSR